MNVLIISDLHLTENSNEAYRWDVFKTARSFLLKHNIPQLYIMGDLLDRKDRHPSELVNRLINELVQCSNVARVSVLKGNHDYLKPEHPFLDFLDHFPNIFWYNTPQRDVYQNVALQQEFNLLWLPHSRTPETDWVDLDFTNLNYVFMHQSVIGCKVSNMFEMNHGLNLKWLTSRTDAKIYSGDIHVPQDIGPLTYIGTQHPVAFGDDYQPRMLWLTDKGHESIPMHTLKRLTLTVHSFKELEQIFTQKDLNEGDHLKIKVKLNNEQLSQWSELKHQIKDWCAFKNIILFDITLEKLEITETHVEHTSFKKMDPLIALEQYGEQEQIDPYIRQLGKDLLTAAMQRGI